MFGLQTILMLVCKVSIDGAIKSIFGLMPFIIFTVLINMLAMDLKEAILIGIRLILICHITYVFGNTILGSDDADNIQIVAKTLKLDAGTSQTKVMFEGLDRLWGTI